MYNKIRQLVSNLETRLVKKRRMLKLTLQQAKCGHIKVNKREGIRGLKGQGCFADFNCPACNNSLHRMNVFLCFVLLKSKIFHILEEALRHIT